MGRDDEVMTEAAGNTDEVLTEAAPTERRLVFNFDDNNRNEEVKKRSQPAPKWCKMKAAEEETEEDDDEDEALHPNRRVSAVIPVCLKLH